MISEQLPDAAPLAPIPGLPSLYELQLLEMLGRLSPDAILDAPLAAIYLRVSEQTLARMRADKTGPVYSQGDSGARNAKVTYKMGNLREWHRSKEISSTMDAAKRRGLCFTTLADFADWQPIWVQPSGSLVSHALTSSMQDFYSKSAAGLEIVWMPMIQAMGLPWADVVTRRVFHKAYVQALATEVGKANAAHEEAEMLASLPEPGTDVTVSED